MTDVVQDSPLMKQYLELKSQAGDALLLFRMGDFYELFGSDAIEASRILEITLTTRDRNKPNPVPMAGVPHHAVQGYLQRLLKAGKKVAIGEQMEDPALAKNKIVKRAITRVFTPGVQFDMEGVEANYLAALVRDPQARSGSEWALACLDVSTGEALVSEMLSAEGVAVEFSRLPIRQVLRLEHDEKAWRPLEATWSGNSVLVEDLPSNYLGQEQAVALLKKHYGLDSLGAFIPAETAARALGIAVAYATRTQQQEKLAHLRLPAPLRRPKTMILGPQASQHLDLLPGPQGMPSLYELLNRTRSAVGARQLKRWLLAPLKDPVEIMARQEAVREIVEAPEAELDRLSSQLGEVYDLERIIGRVTTRLANPRDTLALGRSLATLGALASLLGQSRSQILKSLRERLIESAARLGPLGERILREQREDAPLVSRDGGIFKTGTSPELDRLLSLGENGQRWLVELETRERELTGIPSLKVRYNRVFGYYIEVTQAHLKNVPAHYQRKQTTVGAERFFTDELKKFEDEIVNASSRQKALEQELFASLLDAIQGETPSIMGAATLLGELDALLALALTGREPGWVFPLVDGSLAVDIESGRHPLVDNATRGAFVPNDLQLSPESCLSLIITGPNMGGKSTVMRQTALIVILGQIGAAVPATRARWGAVSSLYTRIGAHDAIARGQSTFMVEMSELAHILHYADERSLIVLDEIGRGTSTYDGISVAWAALEWLCTRVRARTLFATHYHELTRLAGSLPLTANAHMAVEGARSMQASLRFLYKLKEGAANESFGIHVARIAGLPGAVIQRAWKVLEELEKSSPHSDRAGTEQLSLFASAGALREIFEEPAAAPAEAEPHPVLVELETANVNELTPIQALNFIARLQEMSRESSSVSASEPSPRQPRDR